jgi:hypothetical protein
MIRQTREQRFDARGPGLALFVYDYGEEILRLPAAERREPAGTARRLLSSVFCLFYGYVYWLIFAG